MNRLIFAGVIFHSSVAQASVITGALGNLGMIGKGLIELLIILCFICAGSWIYQGIRAKREPEKSQLSIEQAWRLIFIGFILFGVTLLVAITTTHHGQDSLLLNMMRAGS